MPPQNNPASLMVNVFNGARQPFCEKKTDLLVRIRDGFQNQLSPKTINKPSVLFPNLPVFDNLGDNYRVLVSY